MTSLDYWRLADELSVIQAALLIVGSDPSEIQYDIDRRNVADRPMGYEAAISSLKNAIRSKTISATVRHDSRAFKTYDEHEVRMNQSLASVQKETIRDLDRITAVAFKTEPNWHLTVLKVEDLKQWLLKRGFNSGFFFPIESEPQGFLNPSNPFYARKLAAAHFVWTTVSSNPELLVGKTPSQAMKKCLREHAQKFNLTLEDGNPNNSGIEDVCRVANWKPEGGAAPTPTRVNSNPPSVKKGLKNSSKLSKKAL